MFRVIGCCHNIFRSCFKSRDQRRAQELEQVLDSYQQENREPIELKCQESGLVQPIQDEFDENCRGKVDQYLQSANEIYTKLKPNNPSFIFPLTTSDFNATFIKIKQNPALYPDFEFRKFHLSHFTGVTRITTTKAYVLLEALRLINSTLKWGLRIDLFAEVLTHLDYLEEKDQSLDLLNFETFTKLSLPLILGTLFLGSYACIHYFSGAPQYTKIYGLINTYVAQKDEFCQEALSREEATALSHMILSKMKGEDGKVIAPNNDLSELRTRALNIIADRDLIESGGVKALHYLILEKLKVISPFSYYLSTLTEIFNCRKSSAVPPEDSSYSQIV